MQHITEISAQPENFCTASEPSATNTLTQSCIITYTKFSTVLYIYFQSRSWFITYNSFIVKAIQD